jgi:hypothetical protein
VKSSLNITDAAATRQSVGTRWLEIPHQTVRRASEIVGCSPGQIYAYLKAEALRAMRLGGKTLVTTESLEALLATAKPWKPDRARIAAANLARLQPKHARSSGAPRAGIARGKRGPTRSKTAAI